MTVDPRILRGLFPSFCLGIMALASPQTLVGADEISKPNILFILADDVGREAIGCYGGTSYATPNVDRLASQGMRMHHVYAMPVCHPTRTTFLTGQYPFRLGNPAWGTFPREAESRTVARRLQQAGYATAIAGKWQLCLLKDDLNQPHRMGFDSYCLFGWHEGPRYHQPYLWQDGSLREDLRDRFGPDVYTEFLIDFIEKHQEKPFLAFYSMALCHAVSDDFKPRPPYGPLGRYENFAEMMALMDKYVGRMTAAIDRMGLAKRTLIIFTTDNGSPGSNFIRHENNRFITEKVVSKMNGAMVPGGKGKLTDWGIRVPTLVRWPGTITAGTASDALIDFSDFYPTFLDLAGVPTSTDSSDGRSFAPLLLGRDHKSRSWVFSQLQEQYCVRSKDWKLRHDGRLYHVAVDPDERKAVQPENDTPESRAARSRLQTAINALAIP